MRFDPQEWFDRLDWWWHRATRSVAGSLDRMADIHAMTRATLRSQGPRRAPALLLQGCPALLAASVAFGMALTTSSALPNQQEARYLAHAEECRKTGDLAEALTCYDRLLQVDPTRPEYLFGAAEVAEAAGTLDRALSMMHDLAPEDRAGYGPAHLWIARWLYNHVPAGPETARSIEGHLLRTLRKQPDLVEANTLLAELYLKTNRPAQAEPFLLKILKDRPEFRIQLARVYVALGQQDQAQAQAVIAFVQFRQKSDADAENQEARLHLADAATLLGRFPVAVRVLERGLTLHQSPVYRRALAGVYAVWSDQVAQSVLHQVGDRLALIEQGLRYDSGHVGVLQRLLSLTRPLQRDFVASRVAGTIGFGGSPLDSGPLMVVLPACVLNTPAADPAQARALLESLLLKGNAPAVVHLALANDAWEQGNAEQARQHLEQAYRLAPETAQVCNNLAWILAHREPLDLTRAWQLSNSLVERFPNDPRYRGTRGHVLARMKRWQEAVTDLEVSLQVFADNPATHRALADAYEHLGNPEFAARHRQLATEKK